MRKRSIATAGFAGAAAALAFSAGAAASEPSSILQPLGPARPLDGALVEISGLAPAGGASVYAHTDEAAAIFELDIATGTIVRKFSLGRPAAIGDFEAIVVRGETLALATSDGRILEARLDPRRRALDFRVADTGLGRTCEIEGVAPARADGAYYLACKRAKARLVVYEWSAKDGARKIIDRPLKGLVPNPKDFRAADIVVDRERQTLLVLDPAGAILEVALSGGSSRYWTLGGDHRQAEGLALLADGRLIVADEGKIGKGRVGKAALTLYPPRD
jgi:uncharacterized protein YjiK